MENPGPHEGLGQGLTVTPQSLFFCALNAWL
jgi:hypothetical protein